jgi:hypothetical protein
MKTEGKPGLKMGSAPAVQAEPASDDPTQAALAQLNGARGMVRTQTGYQTAITVQKPRNLKDVEAAILYEAAQCGEDFIYSWRQKTNDKRLDEGDGKVTIEGMSIDGAMICLRNWGNVACPVTLVDETPTHFLLESTFIDLEKGFSFQRLYRQRKSGGPGGKMDADRAEDISFQIGQSKSQRNVVDKSLPIWLINRAIEAAKSSAAEKYKDVAAMAPRAVAGYETIGVSLAQLEARLKKAIADWTPYDLLTLSLIYKAIRDRETSAGEEFPASDGTPAANGGGGARQTGTYCSVCRQPQHEASGKVSCLNGHDGAPPLVVDENPTTEAKPEPKPAENPHATMREMVESAQGMPVDNPTGPSQVAVGKTDGSIKFETPKPNPVVCRVCDGLIEGPVEDPKVVDGRVISGRHPACAAPAKQEPPKEAKKTREPGED